MSFWCDAIGTIGIILLLIYATFMYIYSHYLLPEQSLDIFLGEPNSTGWTLSLSRSNPTVEAAFTER